ncbi:MAG: septum formation initiator family protein [Opitutus sp.]
MSQAVNSPRIITILYFVVFVGLGIWAGALFLDTHAEYKHQQKQAVENRRRLAEAQERLKEQTRILERLRTDPSYVEKVLRERYHARPGELIFRFK